MSKMKSALMDPKKRKKLEDALRGKGKETPNVLDIPVGPVKGKKAGGIMKKKGMAKGGMTKKGMAKGGMAKKGMAAGGMMKKKGMAKGGMAKKGYAMGGVMKKKGMSKGGKLRGNGIAVRGFRAGKMVTMKGS